MSDIIRICQNRGKSKLLACVPCELCHETLYPDSPELVRYRVRQVSTGFMQAPAPAFHCSHAPSCPEARS